MPTFLTRGVHGKALMVFLCAFSLIVFTNIMIFSAVQPTHAADAFVTLDSFSGPAGSTVNVSGGGFANGETVDIFLDSTSSAPVATATAADTSLFGPVAITIPLNASGPTAVIGVGETSGANASNSYYADPFDPGITVKSITDLPGGTITISGTGFAPNENVLLTLDTSSSTATADATGSFTDAPLTIPYSPPKTYVIHATGQSSNASTFDFFYVGGFYPYFNPSAYFILPGNTLTFSGGGFAPGETVTVFDGTSTTVLSTFTVGDDGTFTAAGGVDIPANSAAGDRTFRLTGNLSLFDGSVTITVGQFLPQIFPSAYYILPGTDLSFSGTGFAPNETINIFDASTSTSTPLATFAADNTGAFTNAGTITIPLNWAGTKRTLSFQGASSDLNVPFTLGIEQFNSLVSLSGYFLMPGDTLTFSGSGFAPNETIDVLDGTSTTPLISFAADAAGAFSKTGSFTIPFSFPSVAHSLRIQGEASKTSATVVLTVGAFFHAVTASSYYLHAGDMINFSGTGFAPNETISVMNGTTTLSTVTVGADGTFTAAGGFAIPYSFSGNKTLTFNASISGTNIPLTITIAPFQPLIAPSAYYLQRGDTFTVSGSGFAPNEPVQIIAPHNGSITTNADGLGKIISGNLTVPLSSISGLNVTATGQLSGASASTFITVGQIIPMANPDTLTISLNIDNTAGGSATSSDFTISVTGADATPNSFAGSASGTIVMLDGNMTYVITATSTHPEYQMTQNGNCTGPVSETETNSCAITETYIVPPSIDISPATLPDGTVGASYSETITASTTATGPFTWSVASGTLPTGLTLDASATSTTTTLSGTPTADGNFNFAIKVTNGISSSTQNYALNINPAPVPSPSPTLSVSSSGGGNGGGGGGGGGGLGGSFTPPASYFASIGISQNNGNSGVSGTNTNAQPTGANNSGTTGIVLGASTENNQPQLQHVSMASLITELRFLKGKVIAQEFVNASCSAQFTRNLARGMKNSDVKDLQQTLNISVLTQLTSSGAGSPGNETYFFGAATAKAVMAFQTIFSDEILTPNGLTSATGYVGPSTRAKLNSLCVGNNVAVANH